MIVTPFNTMWLLGAGRHVMLLDDAIQGTTCGVLPVGIPVREVTTQGLKWDLGGRQHNHLAPTEVDFWETVRCD